MAYKFMVPRYMNNMRDVWNFLWNYAGNQQLQQPIPARDNTHRVDGNEIGGANVDDEILYDMLGSENRGGGGAEDTAANYFDRDVFTANAGMLQSGYDRWRPQNYRGTLTTALQTGFVPLDIAAQNIPDGNGGQIAQAVDINDNNCTLALVHLHYFLLDDLSQLLQARTPGQVTAQLAAVPQSLKPQPLHLLQQPLQQLQQPPQGLQQLQQQLTRLVTLWNGIIRARYNAWDYFFFFNSIGNDIPSKYRVIVNFVIQNDAMTYAQLLHPFTLPARAAGGNYKENIASGKINFGNHNGAPNYVKCDKMVLYLKNTTINGRRDLDAFCQALHAEIGAVGQGLAPKLSAFYVQTHPGIGCAPQFGGSSYTNNNLELIKSLVMGRDAVKQYTSHHALALDVYERWSKSKLARLLSEARLG